MASRKPRKIRPFLHARSSGVAPGCSPKGSPEPAITRSNFQCRRTSHLIPSSNLGPKSRINQISFPVRMIGHQVEQIDKATAVRDALRPYDRRRTPRVRREELRRRRPLARVTRRELSASSQADRFFTRHLFLRRAPSKVPDLLNLQLINRVYSIHKNIRFHLWWRKD